MPLCCCCCHQHPLIRPPFVLLPSSIVAFFLLSPSSLVCPRCCCCHQHPFFVCILLLPLLHFLPLLNYCLIWVLPLDILHFIWIFPLAIPPLSCRLITMPSAGEEAIMILKSTAAHDGWACVGHFKLLLEEVGLLVGLF